MKNLQKLSFIFAIILASCSTEKQNEETKEFSFQSETFADLKILKYQIPGFDKLNLKQQKLVYFLGEAGYAGRDIIWDQNYRHNLSIRRALENIVLKFDGDKTSDNWTNFITYTKRVWFANGIHHHYSMAKFIPEFTKEYFMQLLSSSGGTLNEEALKAIFNPDFDNKKVNLDPSKGLVLGSAVNFYAADINESEVDEYFNSIKDTTTNTPISYGLNSKLIRGEQGLEEQVYKLNGMYGDAIAKIIYWLEKAITVAENQAQADALKLLVDYYTTGDLKTWDDYNIAWVVLQMVISITSMSL